MPNELKVGDDEDTKTRRNLLVASTIILLFAWLQLPVTAVADRLFGTSLKDPGFSVSEVRVWTAALVMLLYFGWRFWHSSQGQALMRSDTSFAATVKRELLFLRSSITNESIEEYEKSGTDTNVFMPSLSGALEAQWLVDRVEMVFAADELRSRTEFEPPSVRLKTVSSGGFHKGIATIEYTWEPKGLGLSGLQLGHLVKVPFNLGFTRTLRFAVRTTLRAIFATEVGVLLVVPVALAATATLVSIWRLSAAFLLPNIAWCVLPIQG